MPLALLPLPHATSLITTDRRPSTCDFSGMARLLRAFCVLAVAVAAAQAHCTKCNQCRTQPCWLNCLRDCPDTPDEFLLPGGGVCVSMGKSQGRPGAEVGARAASRAGSGCRSSAFVPAPSSYMSV